MASQYSIDINGNKVTVQTFNVSQGAGAKGDVLKIRLPQGAKVEIADTSTKFAAPPKGFRTKKVGNDLHMAFQGSEMAKPDVIIEGFYGKNGAPAELIAKGAKGEYFAFNVPTTETVGSTSPVMGKTAVSPWGNIAGPVEPVIAAERAAPATDPAAVSAATGLPPEGSTTKLGALGWVGGGLLLAAAAAGGGGGGGDSTSTTSAVSKMTVTTGSATEGGNVAFDVTLKTRTTSSITPIDFSIPGVKGDDIVSMKVTFANGETQDLTFNSGAAVNGKILVPAGVETFSVVLTSAQDTKIELDQVVTLNIDGTTATATVVDNDVQSVSTVSNASALEASPLVYTVTLNAASPRIETYTLQVQGGTATAGSDFNANAMTFSNGVTYSASTGKVTIPANVTTFTVSLPTLDDANKDRNETVSLSLTNADGSRVTGTGTIGDTDSQFVTGVAAGSGAVSEGSTLSFSVSLSGTSDQAETYSWVLSGTTNASDFGTPTFTNGVTLSGNTLTVPAGVSGFTVNLPVRTEGVDEDTENVTLAIGGRSSGPVTVNDNDPAPTINISGPSSVAEDGTATYTVSLAGASTKTVTVNFVTNAISATAGTDFTGTNGTLTFTPGGPTSQQITVNLLDDPNDEPPETFSVDLSGATNASIGTGSVTTTINDNDNAPTVTLSQVTANPVAEVDGNVTYRVTLSEASSQAVTVNYATANGTATAGSDYTAKTGTVTIAAGATTATFTVATRADTSDEPDEAFSVALSAPTNATLGATTSVNTTIADDDATPTVTLSQVTANPVAEVDGNVTYQVTLSSASSQNVTVNYATSNGTATAGSDYTAKTGTVTIAAGDTTGTFTVATRADASDEPDETFSVTLSAPTNAALGATTTVTTTIADDDAAPVLPTVSLAQVTANPVAEVDGNVTYQVTLSQVSAQAVTVEYATANGTASAGSDYTTGTGTVTIAAGATTGTFTIATKGDTSDEPNETFSVALSAPTNATLGASSSVTTTIADDDPAAPPPTVATVSTASAPEGTSAVHTVTLSAATTAETPYAATLASGTATVGTDLAASLSESTTSNLVTFSAGNFVVPAGVSTFTVSIPTTTDASVEPSETYQLTVGGVEGVGTITDVVAPGGSATIMSLVSVSATSDTYTPTSGSNTTITDFTTGVGGDLIDVSAFLGAVNAPASSTSVNGIVTTQGAFAGAAPTAQQVATLLAQVTAEDGSHHVVLVKDSADASKAYVFFAEESAADTNTAIDAAEVAQVATINFSAGSTFEDLVLHNIQPTL